MSARGERSHDWHDHVSGRRPGCVQVSKSKSVYFWKPNHGVSRIAQTTVSHESSLRHLLLLEPRSGHVTPHRLPLLETRGLSVGHITSLTFRLASKFSVSASRRAPRHFSAPAQTERPAGRLVCGVAVKRRRLSGTSWGCGRRRPLASRAGEARPSPSARWLQVRGSRRGSGRGRPPLTLSWLRARRRWPAAPWGRR